MLYSSGKLEYRAVPYKLFPKSRFTPATVKLDGVETPARVTCKGHAKFPAYTYWVLNGQVYYVRGNLDGQSLTLKSK